MSDYDLRYDPATTNFGGGAILTGSDVNIVCDRNDLNLKHTDKPDENYLLESTWIEISVKCIEGIIIIGCVDRHPKGKVDIFTADVDRVSKLSQMKGNYGGHQY